MFLSEPRVGDGIYGGTGVAGAIILTGGGGVACTGVAGVDCFSSCNVYCWRDTAGTAI